MNKKPDLLLVLSTIFMVGLAISSYTHSKGILGQPELPVVNLTGSLPGASR